MVATWTFHDPAGTLPDYTFAVKPTSDSPIYSKSMNNTPIVIPTVGGQPLLFEGMDQVPVWSVAGEIITQTQYQTFVAWLNLHYQVLLTDDLGRQRYIYITQFQPVRKRSATTPWRYSYTLSGFTISEVFPTIITPTPPTIPTVTNVNPHVGIYSGGTSVAITGTDFIGVSEVWFGGQSASFVVNSSTSITATAPVGTLGDTVHVRVVNNDLFSQQTPSDLYTYVNPPTITSVSPTSGVDTGGTVAVIIGTAFTGATAVDFGATAAASFTVNSDTQITATTPAHADGGVLVSVTTPAGTGFSSPTSPSFVNGDSIASSSSVLFITVNVPSGLVVGNKLIAYIYGGSGTAYSAAPSGWTLLAKNGENQDNMMAVYWRDIDGSETSSYTFSVTTSGWMAGAICQYAGVIAGLSGFDATPTFDGLAFTATASGDIPAITASNANDLWLGAVGTFDGTLISTPPTGFTLETTTSISGADGIYVWHSAATTGTNGPASWTFDASGTDQWGSVSVLLKGSITFTFVAPPTPSMTLMPTPQTN